MENIELRKLVSECEKYPGTKQAPPASVCNDGFPGTFNLSFIESEWLKEFHGQYLDYDHDYVISKIQPCIRHQDWAIIKEDPLNRHRYLAVFELADIGGVINLTDGGRTEEAVSFSMEHLYDFLTKMAGLTPEKLRITYCTGGRVGHLTRGKYPLDNEIPRDVFKDRWINTGITEDQLIPDDTRDTLLSLNIFGIPTPWGYRNEILYEHQGKLIDIATFEYLYYRPIFRDDAVVDLKRWEHCFVVSAVGIERLLMVMDGKSNITDCDHIKSVKDVIFHHAANPDDGQAIILCEAARAIHKILADCKSYDALSKHRKRKIRDYFYGLFSSAKVLGIRISDRFLTELFSTNASNQPYYPELAHALTSVKAGIRKAEERFRNDKAQKRESCRRED